MSIAHVQGPLPGPKGKKLLARWHKYEADVVGFQAPGTLGEKILSGERSVEIRGQKLKIKAEVKRVRFSGHSDFNQLVDLVRLSRAQQVFIVHGDEPEELAAHLRKKLKKKVFVPKQNQSFSFSVKSK